VHPNDHVNMGQSTNDVFPTATRLALLAIVPGTIEAARTLASALSAKAGEFDGILKTGRTHLQDAVPMTLGQEFSGFAANIAHAAKEVERSARQLLELNLGSTAVGTGLNAGNDFTASAVAHLVRYTGARLRPAVSRFRVTQSMGDVLGYSGALRRLAAEVGKVASDLRLLAMGPRAGIAEIKLPAVQPGSSIMPGKVNPSVPEMVNQVCFQVFGCDATILAATEAGQLELNVMMPVIAWNAIHATRILRQAMIVLRDRSVAGIEADEARCRELLERSTALATALSPYIGYEATADIAKTAVKTGTSIRALVRERSLLPDDKLDRILSAEAMTSPGVPGSNGLLKKSGSQGAHGAPARSGPPSRPRRFGEVSPEPSAEADAGRGGPRKRRAGVRGGAPTKEDDDATTNRAAAAHGADGRTGRRRATTQPAVSSGAAGLPRRPGSRRVAAARSDHGQAAHRGRKRRR
jgi:aspartate ammonia-lyase